MSGGYFSYHQHYIDEIADEIEEVIRKEDSPRPEITKKLCVNVLEKIDETSYRMSYLNFDTYEEALDFFKSRNYEIHETDTELNKRKFIAVSSEKTYEIHEFIYQKYLDKNGKQIYYYNYSKETLNEFKKAIKILRIASVYAQRIDWLLSDDDGEEEFHQRLKEDLKNYKNETK